MILSQGVLKWKKAGKVSFNFFKKGLRNKNNQKIKIGIGTVGLIKNVIMIIIEKKFTLYYI